MLVDELRHVPLFEHLSESQFEWLAKNGEKTQVDAGKYLFREGDPSEYFYVVINGELQITQTVNGEETILATHNSGGFSGEVPMLSGSPYIANARAIESTELLRLDDEAFRAMFSVCPIIVSKLFRALSGRIQTTEALARQREKMAALGGLAAGLAHELNNPAAAARRAADDLFDTMTELRRLTAKLGGQLTADQFDLLTRYQDEGAEALRNPEALDSLERSDREDDVGTWLDDHDVDDGWEMAGLLVDGGMDVDRLEALADELSDTELIDAVSWLRHSLGATQLLFEVGRSTGRISELVKAVKSYSYMDQAPSQMIDLHRGLEDTLMIMRYKLREHHITIDRHFDPAVPPISAFGSELNQVWTNIIDNAIDALGDQGNITVSTRLDGDSVWVEIADDGPGIPEEIQSRIFEPFYTTKDVGKGTGLGLDIVHRIIVNRHNGDIELESQPGATRFKIRLPIQRD
ncbi:MAG: cyclic nucleotide-binding domain-containing protein [Chloroflexi bacterium]|nr:cyclic nucleotide-binding domain-containing protein [Chloroflexota bacterium]